MKNKKEIFFEYPSLFLLLFFSILGWNSVHRAINIKGASNWLVPVAFFSLIFIFFTLLSMSSHRRLFFQLALIFSIFFGLIFIFDFWYLGLLILAYLFLTISISKIRKDRDINIKVSFYKSIRAGSVFATLAFSLAISSHYFFEVRNARLEDIIPKIDLSSAVEKIAPKIISSVNPDFKNLENSDLTVDEWIWETQIVPQKEMLGFEGELGGAEKDLLLQEGRKQITEFSGLEISGQEKVSDVISKSIGQKTNDFISKNYSKSKFPAFPFAASIILFLTVYSLSSLSRPFLIWISQSIFWIFRKLGIVKIAEELRDVEIIQ